MNMCNLLEYSDNYADTSGPLWQCRRDEQNMNNGNPAVVTTDSTSFKYKSGILGKPAANGLLRNAKIIVPLRYLSSFFRSLEMPLINCKIYLELNWTKDYIMSNNDRATTLNIANTKLYVPIVNLSTKDNLILTKN